MVAPRSILLVAVCLAGLIVEAAANHQDNENVPPGPVRVCEKCKRIVGKIRASGSVDRLKSKLEMLCNFSSETEQCIKKVDQMVDQIATMSPEDVCQQIHLCRAKPSPDFHLESLIVKEMGRRDNDTVPACPVKACQHCKRFIARLKKSGRLDELTRKLECMCNRSPNKDECVKKVRRFAHQVATESPERVCRELHFCGPKPKPPPPTFRPMGPNDEAADQRDNESLGPDPVEVCAACQMVVENVKQSGQVGQIEQKLEPMCYVCPEKEQCLKKIRGIADDIEKKSPKEVCEKLHLCSAKPKPPADFVECRLADRVEG